MPAVRNTVLVCILALSGCAAAPAAEPPAARATDGPLGSPFADSPAPLPLIIDRGDLALGTTVMFDRLPTANEMYDVQLVAGLAHVVIVLPAWPSEYAPLEGLRLAPSGIDVTVLLPGYPPSRGAAEVWNLLGAPVRIIVLAQGPPPNPAVIGDLNTMRNLERVIAEMDEPSRTGFERLQRPLSFRKVVR